MVFLYRHPRKRCAPGARVISSLQDVPAEFQPAFPVSETTFPYTVYVPADRLSLFQKRNAMLLCLCADRLVVLEALRIA